MTATADLSAVISVSQAPNFNVSILKSGSFEYVLLYSSAGFDSTQSHIVVLSPDLKVLQSFTGDDISLANPPGVPFSGSAAVSRLGDIVVGNVDFVPTTGGLSLQGKLHTPVTGVDVQLDGPTLAYPAPTSLTWTGFGVSPPGTLNWTAYSSTWGTMTPCSAPLGRNVQIAGVLADPENAANNVTFLVFNEDGSDTQYYVEVQRNPDLINGLPGPPLFNNPAYPIFTKTGLSPDDLFRTADSIIGYENSTQSWVAFSPANPDSVIPLRTGNRKQGQKSAFSFSGGFYCTWNPDSRTLNRYQRWW